MTTLLLIPVKQHASLLDGGPCGFVPPTTELTACRDGHVGPWFFAGDPPSTCPCRGDDLRLIRLGSGVKALVIWLDDAPVLPGIWLLQAAIQDATGLVTGAAFMHSGPYTETEARAILERAESLGIGEGVALENQP